MLLKWMKRKICNVILYEIKTYFAWMFKSVILPIEFDCFVEWVVGVGVLTWGRGLLPRGNSW